MTIGADDQTRSKMKNRGSCLYMWLCSSDALTASRGCHPFLLPALFFPFTVDPPNPRNCLFPLFSRRIITQAGYSRTQALHSRPATQHHALPLATGMQRLTSVEHESNCEYSVLVSNKIQSHNTKACFLQAQFLYKSP